MNASPATDTPFPVELRNVSKLFAGGVAAVSGVSLQVAAGRTVALLGPSGCGKTTTLRLLNRLEEPSAGAVLIRGQDVRAQSAEALRRSIGYVIQEAGLFPHRTVAANVATVPRLLGWDRQRIRRRVAEVLELVGLPEAEYGRRMPEQLSGGQRQRVGVARALAADPDILLMDEPFGALDPGTREALQDEFRDLNTRLHKTVVLVTHDIAEAGRLAEEIVLMERGAIAQRGALKDLLLRPAGPTVRSFLGRRGRWLALEVLRLGDVVADVAPVKPSTASLPLAADLTLAETLSALAGLDETATIVVAGEAYPAAAVRARMAHDLEVAAGER